MKILVAALLALITVMSTYADEKSNREGVEFVIDAFMESWNEGDLPRFVGLFHPDSKTRQSWYDKSQREELHTEFIDTKETFGKMESYKVGLYIERKDRIVLRINYSKRASVSGTISMAKSGDTWGIADWNIDGQVEPELRKE